MPPSAFWLAKTLSRYLLFNGRTGSRVNTQYCWAVLPQGSRAPHDLGETLSQDLKDLKLLQYADDLLITRTSFQQCLISSMVLIIIIIIIIIIILIIANTISTTLKCFASCGYKVSAQKAQICQQAVRFLGFLLEPGKRSLIGNIKEAIIQMSFQYQETIKRIPGNGRLLLHLDSKLWADS